MAIHCHWQYINTKVRVVKRQAEKNLGIGNLKKKVITGRATCCLAGFFSTHDVTNDTQVAAGIAKGTDMSSEFDLQTGVQLREFVGSPGDGFLDFAMTRREETDPSGFSWRRLEGVRRRVGGEMVVRFRSAPFRSWTAFQNSPRRGF